MSSQDLTDWEAAEAIGEKVLEMADRIKKVNPALPGSTANWAFEMDGTRYSVVVKVCEEEPK